MTDDARPRFDTSRQARGVARLLDRTCRRPGRYLIILDVPDPRRRAWRVEVARLDTLRRGEIGRDRSR